MSFSLYLFVHLSGHWMSGRNKFYKFLIFLMSSFIILFIFCIDNAAVQQVDQEYTAAFSEKVLIQAKLAILEVKIMRPHLRHEGDQLIQSCLFNPLYNNKINFLFCKNTSKSPVLLMYSLYVPLNNFQPMNSHTSTLFKQSSILKFQDKNCLENILFDSKYLNDLSLSVFNTLFTFSSD